MGDVVDGALGRSEALAALRTLRTCARCERDIRFDLKRVDRWALYSDDGRPVALICPDCLTEEEFLSMEVDGATERGFVDGGRILHAPKPPEPKSRREALEQAREDMLARPCAAIVLRRILSGDVPLGFIEKWWRDAADVDPIMRRAWAIVYGEGGVCERQGEEAADCVAYYYLTGLHRTEAARFVGVDAGRLHRVCDRTLRQLDREDRAGGWTVEGFEP